MFDFKVIDKCLHGILFGRYCPWCYRWEKQILEAARQLQQERARTDPPQERQR